MKVGILRQPFAQLPEGAPAMADGGLFVTVDFCQRAAVRRVVKDGVVAESMLPARFACDLTGHGASAFEHDLSVLSHRDVRNEPRGARLQARDAKRRSAHARAGRQIRGGLT